MMKCEWRRIEQLAVVLRQGVNWHCRPATLSVGYCKTYDVVVVLLETTLSHCSPRYYTRLTSVPAQYPLSASSRNNLTSYCYFHIGRFRIHVQHDWTDWQQELRHHYWRQRSSPARLILPVTPYPVVQNTGLTLHFTIYLEYYQR